MMDRLKSELNEKTPQWIKNIGLAGVFLGFLISVIASPWANAIIAETAHTINAPGYEKADLDFSMERVTVHSYENGQEVEYYGGLSWENDYRVYETSINHNGEKTLRNVKIDVPLPECVVHTKDSGSGVRGVYEVRDSLDVTIRGSNESAIEVFPCTKRIVTERFSPSETIRVEFVTSRSFEECDLLLGYRTNPDNANIRVQYYFEQRGQVMKERLLAGTSSNNNRFEQPLHRPSTGMYKILKTNFGEYPVIILGKEGATFEDAVAKC